MVILVHISVSIAILIALSVLIINHWTKPIDDLYIATKKISDDHLDIPTLTIHSRDDIGELTSAFNKMADQLQKKDARLQEIIYSDPMTSVRNKGAYEKKIQEMQAKIESKHADFGLIMADIDCLKEINDNYGHECGDENIIKTANVLLSLFDRDCFYRIGGDGLHRSGSEG